LNADYGHDLLFGAMMLPTVEPAQWIVEMAEMIDEVGLDLFGAAEHPTGRTISTALLFSRPLSGGPNGCR
jgi:hypothetical protein